MSVSDRNSNGFTKCVAVSHAEKVEGAFSEHFQALRLPCPRIRWVADLRRGYLRAYELAGPKARSQSSSKLLTPRTWRGRMMAILLSQDRNGRHGVMVPALLPEKPEESIAERAIVEIARREAEAKAARVAKKDSPGAALGLKAWAKAVGDMNSAGQWERTAKEFGGSNSPHGGVFRPFLDLGSAGLWKFWVFEREIVAVPRPVLHTAGNRLHSDNGPAVSWPRGDHFYFWHGVRVSQRIIESPGSIRVQEIEAEPNLEVRRVLMERYGMARYLSDSGAERVDEDESGILYRRSLASGEILAMVRVVNATSEPDGSFREYFLRVPPEIRSAREAVAWTFGLTEAEYRPEVES